MKKIKYNVHEHCSPWLMEFWSMTLYRKREVTALFICISRKIKVYELQTGSELDTTIAEQEADEMT